MLIFKFECLDSEEIGSVCFKAKSATTLLVHSLLFFSRYHVAVCLCFSGPGNDFLLKFDIVFEVLSFQHQLPVIKQVQVVADTFTETLIVES